MQFPEFMRNQKRWMVRRKIGTAKRPCSVLKTKPADYKPKTVDEGSSKWRFRWNQPGVLATHQQAIDALTANPGEHEGLTFVLHPFGDEQEQDRIVCIDFDHAIDPATGEPWSEVRDVLDVLDGIAFVERSRSGFGLHAFVRTTCVPFSNHLKVKLNEHCTVDVLCSNPVAVTGNVFEGQSEIRYFEFSNIKSVIPGFQQKTRTTLDEVDLSDWWAGEPEPLDREKYADLVDMCENWTPAVAGEGRENVTFRAAMEIVRAGVIDWPAMQLLELVPTHPAYELDKLQHKIEDAYRTALRDGTFDSYKPLDEFDTLPPEPKKPIPEQIPNTDKPGFTLEGIEFYTLADLAVYDIKLEWLIRRVCVDSPGETFCFGGREKTFKTSVMADFFVSLATGKPFLNEFEVVTRKRVLFLTAEIGMPSIKSLMRRVCESKDVDWTQERDLIVTTWMPKFNKKASGEQLVRILKRLKPDVVGFDPWYFGASGADVGDMYAMGELLQAVGDICKECGVMPVVAHHSNMSKRDQFLPMGLGELYGAGFQAYIRQWMLLSHAEESTDGKAKLWCSMGGSSFRTPLHILQIDEGETAEDEVDSRHWSVSIEKADGQGGETLDGRIIQCLTDNPELDHKTVARLINAPAPKVKARLVVLKEQGRVHRTGTGYSVLQDDIESGD